MSQRVAIIGAGIAGLSLAIGLQKKGFLVTVFEQASEYKKVGAGIILGNNAMQVFRKLGLSEQLQSKGNYLSSMQVTDNKNKVISKMDFTEFERTFDSVNLAIHRSDLQQILFDNIQGNVVQFSKKLSDISESDGVVKLTFEDGSKEICDLCIGGDGFHSSVRNLLFPEVKYRDAKQVCWRGITETKLSSKFENMFTEMWGDRARMGFGQINETEVYWFALLNFEKSIEEYTNVNWRDRFQDFIPEAQQLLENTPDEKLHVAAMQDFQPIKNWTIGKVCLIGDAAHAMTPNMGQGAGQGIEDAHLLAQLLGLDPTNSSFLTFQNKRMAKVKGIVQNSWRLGKIAQLESKLWRKIRNLAMRMLPTSSTKKQLKKTYTLNQ